MSISGNITSTASEIDGNISNNDSISGSVTDKSMGISGEIIRVESTLEGDLSNSSSIEGSIIILPSSDVDVYTGEHVVVPKTTEQVLKTAHKLVKQDITVKEVPYFETSNESGYTVYIASEV